MTTKKIILTSILLLCFSLLTACGGDGIGGTGKGEPGFSSNELKATRISVPFRENGYSNFKTQIIDTESKFRSFVNNVKSQNNWNNKAEFLQTIEAINVDFENENLLIYRLTESSGSITLNVNAATVKNKEMTVKIDRNVPNAGGTADMAYYVLAYQLDKNIIKATFDKGTTKTVLDLANIPKAQGILVRSSQSELLNYFQKAIKAHKDTVNYGLPADSMSNVSTTNLQEAGVDEADLIKTDGRYIYSVKKIEKTLDPLVDNSTIVAETYNTDIIRILDTQGVSGVTELKRLSNSSNPWNIAGLYLDNTSSVNNRHLIALSSDKQNYLEDWFDSSQFQKQKTDVLFVDINDPKNAKVVNKLSFEGQLIDSRRNGDTLYLVMRHYPDYEYIDDKQLATTTTETFLPSYTVNDENKKLIVKPENCFLEKGQQGTADVITLVAVDLKQDNPSIKSQCYVGSAEAVYASKKAFYLATTRWGYTIQNGLAEYNHDVTTDIHKFGYNGLNIEYRGSGQVDGHLGNSQSSKSFRFSEQNDLLRVVTFDQQMWGGLIGLPEDVQAKVSEKKSPVLLSILKEDPNSQSLQIVSKLPNTKRPDPIGLPDEKLYATRFIGNRAYVVTFRITDPLYVIDLSDITDPKILGELKIDGYSDYLHPISETLLLGIGKDAISDATNGDGRGAWYQGIKLSLIDVTDPSNPKEADKVIIGKRGTESAALHSHHAVTTLNVNQTYQVAIPVDLHEEEPQEKGSPVASTYYGYTHTGLYRFNIDINNQTIRKIPAMIIDNQKTPYWGDSSNDRSVIIKDTVFFMHDGEIWTQDWAGNNKIIGPK